MLHQFAEEFFTFDNRFYKTLKPLIISPGRVTMDYNRGKRARYMPLLKLYFFVSFTLFLLMPYSSAVSISVGDMKQVSAQAALTKSINRTVTVLKRHNETPYKPVEEKEDVKPKSNTNNFFNSLGRKISEKGPAELRRRIIGNFPQIMFLLMPFFALLIKLFYRRSDDLYTHHLVFSLHFHTFAFILFVVMILCDITGIGLLRQAASLLVVLIPWYLYRGMKLISGQSRVRTMIKTVILLLFYWVVSTVGIAAMILLTILF